MKICGYDKGPLFEANFAPFKLIGLLCPGGFQIKPQSLGHKDGIEPSRVHCDHIPQG